MRRERRCCAVRRLPPECAPRRDDWRSEMDEFGGGFMRNMMIGFALALAFSIVYVWYTR